MNDSKIRKRIVQLQVTVFAKRWRPCVGYAPLHNFTITIIPMGRSCGWDEAECSNNARSSSKMCCQERERVELGGHTGSRTKASLEFALPFCSDIKNLQMNLIQRIVSLLLYSGHALKQVVSTTICYSCVLMWLYHSHHVFWQLQNLLLCLSHKRTIAYVDTLGKEGPWCKGSPVER